MASLAPRIDNIEAGRNQIINGNFDFWQRGVGPLALSGTNQFVADRFASARSATWTGTYAQSTDVPTLAQSGMQSRFSLLITNGTGAAAAAGDVFLIEHQIEGQDYASLHGKPIRLQFWVKSSVVGTFPIKLSNSARDRTYIATYSISLANTWEKKTIDLTADNVGTWLFDNGSGLRVVFTLAAGTTFQTANANVWQAGNFYGTTSTTNWAATTGATFRLSQVQLVQASLDSNSELPFKRAGKTIQEELAMCQRYFCLIDTFGSYFTMFSSTATTGVAPIYLAPPVDMRATPTTTIANNATILVNITANSSTAQTISVQGVSSRNIRAFPSGTATGVVYGFGFAVPITADAEF